MASSSFYFKEDDTAKTQYKTYNNKLLAIIKVFKT